MLKNFFSVYSKPAILIVFALGFSSGLPLALTATTLGAWLTKAGLDMKSIGLFAAIGTPYALKFLWSPLIDAVHFPVLCKLFGRRRGWLLATQFALVASLLALSLTDPAINVWNTAFMALLVAIFSASQDIVIDAYRVESLKPEQYGAGAAAVVLGYRFGMIASTALPLYLSDHISWHAIYLIMSTLVGVGILTTLIAREPPQSAAVEATQTRLSAPLWLREHVVLPFADFMTRPHWLALLLFIVLYKFADAFMGVMTTPFLLHTGFTGEQLATVMKLYGVIATIVGSFFGGALVFRLGITRTLWICGIAHMFTNLMFVVQARLGADVHFLILSVTLENISGGMGTAAFVAFMSSLTHVRFTATQYALLSSFAAFGRTWLSTPSGRIAEALGWEGFFTFASLLALPGLALLWWLSKKMDLDHQKND